jgi:hypothetical protein
MRVVDRLLVREERREMEDSVRIGGERLGQGRFVFDAAAHETDVVSVGQVPLESRREVVEYRDPRAAVQQFPHEPRTDGPGHERRGPGDPRSTEWRWRLSSAAVRRRGADSDRNRFAYGPQNGRQIRKSRRF